MLCFFSYTLAVVNNPDAEKDYVSKCFFAVLPMYVYCVIMQLFLGVVLALVVIVTACFSYYQVKNKLKLLWLWVTYPQTIATFCS